MTTARRPSVIIFDVNETLIDMSEVKSKVNKLLNIDTGFKLWFGMLLQYALVDTVTGNYHDFATIGRATLEMAAQALESKLTAEDIENILATMKNAPPHEDVKEGLKLLKAAGYRLVTLTNSPPATLEHQLKKGRISTYFDATLSVDEFKMYKPYTAVYKKALEKLGVQPKDALMVAAHGWDIAGALAAGMQAALIERKGQSLYPLAPEPQLKGRNLIEVARSII